MMCAVRELAAQDSGEGALRVRLRRGVRREGPAGHRLRRRARLRRRLRDHGRADQPPHRDPGQGRARDAPGDQGPLAHGSTPWLGDNAVLKAVDVFRSIESLPFSRESSDLFDRPSISLGRIVAGDAINRVPDLCAMDLDIRYLPGQDPEGILERDLGAARRGDRRRSSTASRSSSSRDDPYVQVLAEAVSNTTPVRESIAVGRDGTSEVISFLNAGTPAWSSAPSATATTAPRSGCRSSRSISYREALVEFVRPAARASKPTGDAGDADGSSDRREPRLRRQPTHRASGSACCWARCWWCSPPPAATSVAAFREVDKVVDALRDRRARSSAPTWPRPTRASRRRSCCSAPTAAPTTPPTAGRAPARARTRSSSSASTPTRGTALMSLPRDLKVEIPGHGTDKINAAYELGGPKLTLQTVKRLTGLPVNHVINVDFNGFKQAVDAIGCIYLDIDRRYFNDTAEFAYINIYARLPEALRGGGARVRALPPRGHRPRALRPPAGAPARGQAADGCREADQRPQQADPDLRQVHHLGRRPQEPRGHPAAAQAGCLLGGPADPRGALRGRDHRRRRGDGRAQLRDGLRRHRQEARAAVPRCRGHRRPTRQGQAAPGRRRSRRRPSSRPRAARTTRSVPSGRAREKRLPVYYPTVFQKGSTFTSAPRAYRLKDRSGKASAATAW